MQVETGLISGKPDVYDISIAILLRLACAFLFALLKWYGYVIQIYRIVLLTKQESPYRDVSNKMHTVLFSKVTNHLQLLLMKANLHLDLASSQGAEHYSKFCFPALNVYTEAATKSPASAKEAWEALDSLIRLINNMLQSGSQMAFIGHVARSTGGPWFVLLSLSHPILSTYLTPALWTKGKSRCSCDSSSLLTMKIPVFYGFVSNQAFQRIKALEKLADGTLRQDIISGGLAEWIASGTLLNYGKIF